MEKGINSREQPENAASARVERGFSILKMLTQSSET
jgi:hypothetical protein